MKFSIIIPYHSNRKFLDICISSLLETVPQDVEVIIVVNNSNTDELNIAIDDARCRILKVERELYYPRAINYGVENARGKYVIFCDADTCYTEGWFEALTTFYVSHPDAGYCSSKLLAFDDGSIIDFGIGFTAYNSPHPFKGRPFNHPLVMSDFEAQAACAANSMISKELFIRVGGFNETLVHSYSDIDLCLKLKEIGYSTYCVHNSVVFHMGNSTIGSGMSESLKSDTKGKYMALNSSRIQLDMDRYFEIGAKHFFSVSGSFMEEYYMIDFTTIADKQWHYDVLSQSLRAKWLDKYNRPYKVRDAHNIALYHELDANVRGLRFPLLFFVDDFRCLRGNAIWMHLRDCSRDIVADRNANILPFLSL